MDYLQAIKDKEAEQSELTKRMDADKDLLYLSKYTLKDKKGKEIPGVINTTLNDPAVFAANVISALGATTEQIVVEGEKLKDKDKETTYIEEFLEAAIGSANNRLRKQDRPDLNPFFDEQFCIRGRAGFRCLFREEEGVVIPDIMPLDTRYVSYEVGQGGFDWASYKTRRSKGKIKAEYDLDISAKDAEIIDVWDKEHFEVFIDRQKKREKAHKYGYPPFGIQTVPLGSMLLDKDSFSHWGESIFFLIRDLIPELNRMASILQTLNMATIKGAKWIATKEGMNLQISAEDAAAISELGAVTPIDIGGGVFLVPLSDIKNATRLLHSMIDQRIQAGSLSRLDLGTLTFPLSAVALIEIGESRDQIFLPRLQAKALLNQQLAEMITEQVIAIGGSVELGSRGHKRSFETSKLQGEYEVKYRYFTKSPKVDVARYSMAAAAGSLISEDTKRRDILQLQDPDGEKHKLNYELAEKLSPVIARVRVIESLIEQGEDFEAELMAAELGMSLEQIMRGELPSQPKEAETAGEPKAPEQLVPLFGKEGAGPTSAKKAAERAGMPRAEEGEE